MNKSYKYYIVLGFGLLILAWWYSGWYGCQKIKALVGFETMRDTTLVRKRDAQGREHASGRVQQVPKEIYNNSNDSELVALRKKVKAQDLVIATMVKTNVKGSFTAPVHDTVFIKGPGDTTVVEEFSWRGKYLHFSGSIVKDTFGKRALVDYDYDFDFDFTAAWERPKWYKKKELRGEIIPKDPQATVVSARTVIVQQDPPRWYERRGVQAIAVFAIGFYAGNRLNR